jgi:hypothetical protein
MLDPIALPHSAPGNRSSNCPPAPDAGQLLGHGPPWPASTSAGRNFVTAGFARHPVEWLRAAA